jgi:hypothetical protein
MLTSTERQHLIGHIQRLPINLEVADKRPNERQWDTPYREGGGTIRQVMHHLADSHLSGFVRMKLILTQNGKSIVLLAKCISCSLWHFAAPPLPCGLVHGLGIVS